jgi:hypothetical protein
MRNLFDLLDASSDEDADELKKAFRKAGEARRDAQARLDALIRAEFERQPLRPKPARPFFISAVALAVLALWIGGGGLFLADALPGPDEGAKVTKVTARGLSQPAASTGMIEQEGPRSKLEGAAVPSIAPAPNTATGVTESGDVAGTTENGPAPSLPGSGIALAKVTEDTRAAIDQPDVKTGTDELENSARIEPSGQNENQNMAGALPTIAAAQPAAPAGTTEQEAQPGKLEGPVVPSIALAPRTATGAAERGDVAGNTENGPAPSPAGPDVERAKLTEDIAALSDPPGAKTTVDQFEKSEGIGRPGHTQNQVMPGSSPEIAAVRPALPTNTTEQEEPPSKLEGAVVASTEIAPSAATGAAERGNVAGTTENRPAPSPRSGVEVAKVTEDSGAATDQPDAKTAAGQPKKSEGIERPGRNLNRARSAEVELSLETDKNAPQSSSADHPTAGDNAIGNADAADTKSTDPKFYRDRGMAFYRNGDLDRALADFDTAIQLDPRSASAYIDRSIVLYRKAEPDRAFADIAQAIRIEDSLKAAAKPHRLPAPPPKH